jgi:hypothetical protein
MQTHKTQEEVLASRIKARNYSDILSTIYSLRSRARKDYFPNVYPSVVIFGDIGGSLGGNNSLATFDVLRNGDGDVKSSFSKGESIKLYGFASYIQIADGVTSTKVAPKIEAHLGLNAQGKAVLTNGNQQIPHEIIECLGTKKQSNGYYEFIIETDDFEIGKYFVYIDAASPNGKVKRLVASGTSQDTSEAKFWETYNVRSFEITAPVEAIAITTQPVGFTLAVGNAVALEVGVSSATYPKPVEGTTDYQWQYSSDNTNWTNLDVADRDACNATDRKVISFIFKTSSAGFYRCRVTNSAGTVISNSAQLVLQV